MKRLLVVPLLGMSAHDAVRKGARAPVIGRYLNSGSFGAISDADLESLVAPAALDPMAAVSGITLSRPIGCDATLHEAAPHGASPHGTSAHGICALPPRSMDAADTTEWDEAMGRGVVLALIFAEQAASAPAGWAVSGFGVPSFGRLPDARRTDLWATWLTLAGGRPAAGLHLLEEPEAALDADGDAALIERLQRLYGE